MKQAVFQLGQRNAIFESRESGQKRSMRGEISASVDVARCQSKISSA